MELNKTEAVEFSTGLWSWNCPERFATRNIL